MKLDLLVSSRVTPSSEWVNADRLLGNDNQKLLGLLYFVVAGQSPNMGSGIAG